MAARAARDHPEVQLHGPGPAHGKKLLSTHVRPVQHAVVTEHDWPFDGHEAAAQWPVMQARPEQQSAPEVQTPVTGWQAVIEHCRLPPSAPGMQGVPLQHWSLNWHDWPWAMQHGATPV